MASSSRPFQSQTVSRLLAGYRQMAQVTERLLRQGRTALLWGVQVVAFPLYVAFQGIRSASRTLQATKPWQRVVTLITGTPSPPPIRLSTDAPIRALLSLTQPQAVRQPGGLRYVDCHGELLRQSRAESVMVNGQWQLVPLQTPVCGVASDLATRQLVLVTTNNVIFAGLTDLQREQLQRAITLLLAEYASWCRRQWHQKHLQSPGLPLPQAGGNQWFPVRWVNQALGWMQASPLAQVTNLFGEAQPTPQLASGGRVRWWDRVLSGPGRPALEELSTSGHGTALVVNPYTSIPVPYGVSVWDRSASTGSAQSSLPEGGALTVAGASSVVTQPRSTREVATGPIEDGTLGFAAAAAESTPLDRGLWDDSYPQGATSRPAGWGRSMGGPAGLKGLPGHDAIEAQVALVNYVDHPLVMVLRWLDALLHGAETWLQRAWQWLRQRF